MAIKLQTAIHLQDLFSRPLMSISSSVSETTQNISKLEAAADGIKGTFNSVAGAANSASLDGMNNSILKINAAIQNLEDKKRSLSVWDTNGVINTQKQIESLNQSLYNAKKAQKEVNAAIRNGNADKIKQSYVKFNSEIEKTKNLVNQNTSAQNNFKNEIEETNKSVKKSESLYGSVLRKITAVVGAYAGFKSANAALDMSDTAVQTTARLNMTNDGKQTTDELEKKIFASAQRARTSYGDTADVVAKLGLRAGDAFSSNDETIAFAENLNKMFVIAGASQQEMSSASLQLTQALGSGVLRGEELNAVFETAPNVIQTIADYIGKPIGEIRDLAAEGKVTADVVKNALLGASQDIDKQFNSMPMTFGQMATTAKNKLLMSFKPALTKLNEMLNNPEFQSFANNFVMGLCKIAEGSVTVLEKIGDMGNKISDTAQQIGENWDKIAPIITPIAVAIGAVAAAFLIYNGVIGIASAAQAVFNATLLTCPLTWIVIGIIAIIAAIYLGVAAFNKLTGSSVSATGIIMGALSTAGAFIWNLFLGFMDIVNGTVEFITNRFTAFANFFGNVLNDPVASIIHLFGDLADNVLGVIEKIASAIDKVFGSNLANSVKGWRSGLEKLTNYAAETYGNGKYKEKIKDLDIDKTFENLGINFDRISYKDAWNNGYNLGENIDNGFDGLGNLLKGVTDEIKGLSDEVKNGGDSINKGLGDMSEVRNVGDVDKVKNIKGDVSLSDEDLKSLRELATTEYMQKVNQNTIAPVLNVRIDKVTKEADIDKVIDRLTTKVGESLNVTAEGGY